MAKITEIHGNIFESSCQTLVNTVNCVGVMGKGIAFEYRHRFPAMYQAYARLCSQRSLKPGLLQLWNKTDPWILNFPTKNDWKHPSKLSYVEDGLRKFANTYNSKGITSIAFPQLGTSAGGLEWRDVKGLMYSYLQPLPNLDIEIYHFDTNATDSFFDRLHQRVHRFTTRDYQDHLGLRAQQAALLYEAMRDSNIKSMLDVQNVPGLGEKTFEKIYGFVNDDRQRLQTQNEVQPSLI